MLFLILGFLGACALTIPGCLTFWKINEGWQFYHAIVLAIAGYVVGLLLAFLVFTLIGLTFKKEETYTKSTRLARFMLKSGYTFLHFHGLVITKFKGLDKLPKNKRFLLVCNHRSNFDPILLCEKLMHYEVAAISKPENFKIPMAGPYVYANCYMGIQRDNILQSLEVMKKAAEFIINDQNSVLVFPEGKRQTKEIIGPFHEGVFNIAIKSQCPIVVFTVKKTEQIHKHFPLRFTKVTFNLLDVIPYEEYVGMTAKKLSDAVRDLMLEDLQK